MFEERRRRVLERASKEGYGHLVAATPQNTYYLADFWGSGYLVLSQDRARFITGPLEGERARSSLRAAEVITVPRGKPMLDSVASLLEGAAAIGVDDVSASVFLGLSKRIGGRVNCAPQVFLDSRRAKDPSEVSTLLEGGRIVDRIYARAAEVVKPGVSERKIAGELLLAASELGCDIPGFSETLNPFIVASGPNSAYPHAALTDRVIRRGDYVVLDLVVRYRGYIVDTTRTFAVGTPTSDMKRVYAVVQRAQIAGVDRARTGEPAREVDRASREVIEAEGFGDAFIHSTGHGVGIDVHEAPRVASDSVETLQSNDAITVEPGIYLTGRFGVRIEDSLLVGAEPRLLTGYPRELLTVG